MKQMEHEAAAAGHIPEQYYLGELSREERDAFEEHLADCSRCRSDMALTDVFAANARAVFEDESLAQATAKQGKWFDFLRVPRFPVLAFSGALNVALLLFAVYGVTRLARRPELLPEAAETFTVRPPARGAETQVFSVKQSQGFVIVRFDLPRAYQRYSWSLEGAGKNVALQVQPNAEELSLMVPLASLQPGDHNLNIVGVEDRQEFEIGHCVLKIQPSR